MKLAIERFNKKYQKDNNTGCWNWIASVGTTKYGQFWYKGRPRRAHRWSYKYYVGSIGDKSVCHSCDNPSCVNPDHLFLRNHQGNMDDKVEKSRQIVNHGKLSFEDERMIYELYNVGNNGLTLKQIAEVFDLAEVSMNEVLRRYENKISISTARQTWKLSSFLDKEIYHKYYYENQTGPELAKEYNVAKSTIYLAIKRHNINF